MNICFVTSECIPFAKTGGLADVSGALPKELSRLGHTVKLILPLYDSIHVSQFGFVKATELSDMSVQMGDESIPIHVWFGHLPDSTTEVYLVDCPRYFHRGRIYTNDADELDRFVLLQHAAFNIMQRYGFSPDIIHANDWQAALMPAMLKYRYNWDDLFKKTQTILSIHNLAYQGWTNQLDTAYRAGLPMEETRLGGEFEYSGGFSCLKTGIMTADWISTVSPTYAREIQSERFGEGLEQLLRMRSASLRGILNGIDVQVWNPETDPLIPHHFSTKKLTGKAKCKLELQVELGLASDPILPLMGIVSRFASQKGFDLLMASLSEIMKRSSVQFAVLGSGEAHFEAFFSAKQNEYPGRFAVRTGYDEGLAHRIEAGSDMFLMPSYYEPCGLNQMYSLRYGTIPIVHKTGGLADTVVDVDEFPGSGTGFSFWDATPDVLKDTIFRALDWFEDRDAWKEIQLRGMRQDFGWEESARSYLDLYSEAMLGTAN